MIAKRLLIATVMAVSCLTSAPVLADPLTYALAVEGMACRICAARVKRALLSVEGVEAAEVDVATGAVMVRVDENARFDEAAAREVIEALGFRLNGFERAP